MSCYSCGSDQGNEAQLCPECRIKRAQIKHPTLTESLVGDYKLTPKRILKLIFGDLLRVLVAAGMICSTILYYLCFSDSGPGWFSIASRLERRCKSVVDEAATLRNSGAALPAGHVLRPGGQLDQFFQQQFGTVGSEMITAMANGQFSICTDLKTTCRAVENKEFCSNVSGAF